MHLGENLKKVYYIWTPSASGSVQSSFFGAFEEVKMPASEVREMPSKFNLKTDCVHYVPFAYCRIAPTLIESCEGCPNYKKRKGRK